jgi:hypothetical protein
VVAESQTPELIPPVPAPTPEGFSPDAATLPTVVVKDASAPPPLGRTWAFDLRKGEFVRIGSQGPRAIYGAITLLQWIEKCLHTERGALPIHPPGYGLEDPQSIYGRPIRDLSKQELQRKIQDALTFHPRIAAVANLQLVRREEAAFCTFQVQTDPPLDAEQLLTIRLAVGAG